MRLQSWDLKACLFDGEHAAGPVPSLFTTDIEATLQAIAAEPKKTHWDCQRLAKIFFTMESISLGDCTALLKKPR